MWKKLYSISYLATSEQPVGPTAEKNASCPHLESAMWIC
jgi:hypothetical protein